MDGADSQGTKVPPVGRRAQMRGGEQAALLYPFSRSQPPNLKPGPGGGCLEESAFSPGDGER